MGIFFTCTPSSRSLSGLKTSERFHTVQSDNQTTSVKSNWTRRSHIPCSCQGLDYLYYAETLVLKNSNRQTIIAYQTVRCGYSQGQIQGRGAGAGGGGGGGRSGVCVCVCVCKEVMSVEPHFDSKVSFLWDTLDKSDLP